MMNDYEAIEMIRKNAKHESVLPYACLFLAFMLGAAVATIGIVFSENRFIVVGLYVCSISVCSAVRPGLLSMLCAAGGIFLVYLFSRDSILGITEGFYTLDEFVFLTMTLLVFCAGGYLSFVESDRVMAERKIFEARRRDRQINS